MKKIITIVLFFLCGFQVCLSDPPPQDTIAGFLTEYTDGKPTGRIIELWITVIKMDKGIYWSLEQTTIDSSDDEKSLLLRPTVLTSDNSKEIAGLLYLSDIHWTPNENFSCIFLPDGNKGIKLEAKKIPQTKCQWDVRCKGQINLAGNPKVVPWEWKFSKEVNLKYNKVRVGYLYRD